MAELLEPLEIAFMHPDLGIGGAERLVVDCALGLKSKGHSVTIYTSHCDMDHCFEEVKNGEIDVQVIGDSLPTHIFGKFAILCATLRQFAVTWHLVRTNKINSYDLLIMDQLSTSLPFLTGNKPKTLFYCHFPDQLLAKQGGLLKKIYRFPFNWVEQYSTGTADGIVVNSNFTKSIFYKTYKMISERFAEVDVIYPCVETGVNLNSLVLPQDKKFFKEYFETSSGQPEDEIEFLLSINRFERKKDIELAIKSFKNAQESLGKSRVDKTKLIIAGGYDNRVLENVEYLIELEDLARSLHLNFETIHYNKHSAKNPPHLNHPIKDLDIIFMTSISTSLKNLLISKSRLLMYTPSFEHFGIVPIEAMNLGTPVLACNNGGPKETVEHDKTGWLAEPTVDEWTKYILVCLLTTDKSEMVEDCKKRVLKNFSRIAMTESLEEKISKLLNNKKPSNSSSAVMAVMATVNMIVFYLLQFLFEEKHHYYIYGIMMVFNTVLLRSQRWGFYWLVFAGLIHFRT